MGNSILKQAPQQWKKALGVILVLLILKQSTKILLNRLKASNYREIVERIKSNRDDHIEEFFKTRASLLGSGLKDRILGCHSIAALQEAVKKGQFTYEEIFLAYAERTCIEGRRLNLIGDINLNEGFVFFSSK